MCAYKLIYTFIFTLNKAQSAMDSNTGVPRIATSHQRLRSWPPRISHRKRVALVWRNLLVDENFPAHCIPDSIIIAQFTTHLRHTYVAQGLMLYCSLILGGFIIPVKKPPLDNNMNPQCERAGAWYQVNWWGCEFTFLLGGRLHDGKGERDEMSTTAIGILIRVTLGSLRKSKPSVDIWFAKR